MSKILDMVELVYIALMTQRDSLMTLRVCETRDLLVVI